MYDRNNEPTNTRLRVNPDVINYEGKRRLHVSPGYPLGDRTRVTGHPMGQADRVTDETNNVEDRPDNDPNVR
jgi:hypothetical protein